MNKEQEARLSKLKFRHQGNLARYKGLTVHQQHTKYRRSTIASILKIDVKDVDELIKCIAGELPYVKG